MKQRWEETEHGSCGLVVRTNGETVGIDAVFQEFETLYGRYQAICNAAANRTCYSVLYRPESFAVRAVRDLKISDGLEVVTDLPEIYRGLKDALGSSDDRTAEYSETAADSVATEMSTAIADVPATGSTMAHGFLTTGRPSLRFYEDDFPLTALYHLETILSQALSKTVWLKSGGNLVIEPTEALTVIDVNTAKSVSKKASEETYLKTNLEAAGEIAVQLRLRNLSGIIIVDFIDMKEEESRKTLLAALRRAIAADPVKTVLVDMTPLGLVELTRMKIRRPLYEQAR